MLNKLPSFDRLVHELGRMPGVGPKTAQRLAYFLLRTSNENIEKLREALSDIKENIRQCPSCYSYTEDEDLCPICADPHRTDESVCVVEDPADISRIDNSGAFRGRYHVLHGAISPLDGVSPKDLKIQALIDKVNAGKEGQGPEIKEVILALDADLEGDTTVLYLAKILSEKQIKVTRIAHGVPIGGDIDYIDHRTLGRALENRVQV